MFLRPVNEGKNLKLSPGKPQLFTFVNVHKAYIYGYIHIARSKPDFFFYNHCFIDHNKQLKSMTNDDCLGYLLFSQQSTRHRYNIQYTINNIQYTMYTGEIAT